MEDYTLNSIRELAKPPNKFYVKLEHAVAAEQEVNMSVFIFFFFFEMFKSQQVQTKMLKFFY